MTGKCLTKAFRLLSPTDFKQTLSDGKRQHTTGFTVFIKPNGLDTARLGLSIAKKHVRFAHERNRLKRLIREHFRLQREALPQQDFVFLVKPGVSELSNDVLNHSLTQFFSRIISNAQKPSNSESPQGVSHA